MLAGLALWMLLAKLFKWLVVVPMCAFMSVLVIMTNTSQFHLILRGCDMSFIHHANKASNAERQGRFAEAYQFWVEAVHRARKDVNRNWAECRADYCLKSLGGYRAHTNSSTV